MADTIMVRVNSAAPVEGTYGPQWALDVIYPWSKFPTKAWIPRLAGEDAIMPGEYPCVVERGQLREGRDPEREFNYNWRITAVNVIDTEGPTLVEAVERESTVRQERTVEPSKPTPAPSYEDAQAITRKSIERQVSLKEAVSLHVQLSGTVTAADGLVQDVLATAERFYEFLRFQELVPFEKAVADPEVAPALEEAAENIFPPEELSFDNFWAWAKQIDKKGQADVTAALGGKPVGMYLTDNTQASYASIARLCAAKWGVELPEELR
jgi:hypothetical protein